MTDFTVPPTTHSPDCQAFEDRLPDYLDGSCSESDLATLNTHRAACAQCNSLVRELEQIVKGAAALPDHTPSRDLWSGIETRLSSDITALPSQTAATPLVASRRMMSVRTFAIAATLLVAVTSGVTWRLARQQPVRGRAATELAMTGAPARIATDVPAIPSANVLTRSDSVRLDSVRTDSRTESRIDAVVPTRLVASSPADVDAIYEREIAGLRRIVTERFSELDSVTVVELRRNLDIIDAAIADSRRALKRDPRSRLLSTQLDRALETKLALMRRMALL